MSDTGKFPRLARLLAPVSVDDFVSRYWERGHVHVPATARGAEAADIPVTVAEVDAILASKAHRHPSISLTDAVREVESEEYTDADDVIETVRFMKRFSAGATIVINRLDESVPRVRQLCSDLESELGIHVQCNMYLTPRNAQGFATHYDNHDVLIVQCEGRKRWRLYDMPKPLPMRGERFNREETRAGALSTTFVMEPGDVLYVPRGLMHDAVNEGDDVSLHITVGFHAVRWTEVLLEAVAAAASDDVELRRGIPLGALTGAVPDAALAQSLQSHAARVLANLRWERVRPRVEDQYLHDHKENLHGLLLDATTLVDAKTVFEHRPGAKVSLRDEGEAVVLDVLGRTTRWPGHARTTLQAALARPRFTLADLGEDLDEKGRATLARRLMAEGAVRIARGGA